MSLFKELEDRRAVVAEDLRDLDRALEGRKAAYHLKQLEVMQRAADSAGMLEYLSKHREDVKRLLNLYGL